MRADLTFEIPPGRIASSTSSAARRAPPPRREALAQAQEGDVAVAVVGGLRQHREDQLGDRVAVRGHQGHAVDVAQAVADARARARATAATKAPARRVATGTAMTAPPPRAHGIAYILAARARGDESTTGELDGLPVFWRSADAGAGRRRRVGPTPRCRSTCTACPRARTMARLPRARRRGRAGPAGLRALGQAGL